MTTKFHAGYEEEIREYRLEFSRGGAYTGIILILLGIGLDYGLYPDKLYLFGIVRFAVALFIYAIVLLFKTAWGKTYAKELTFIWLLAPQIMITWMIGVTDGANSLYSVGLHLAIFATSITLPFGVWLNLLGAISLLLYLVACSFHPKSFALYGPFVINSLFLIFVVAISAVCTYFNERTRFTLFRLKAEVANKNKELEETNKNLAQIKGQMLQQEKMAAVGTLSAGLLHEVNNPINFCLMAIGIALEEPEAKSNATLNECLTDAKQGMQRVQHIVSDLKTFAYRKPDTTKARADFLLERALDTSVRLTSHELKNISITRELPPDTLVHGDEAAIIGVVINLLSNSALALHKTRRSNMAIHISAIWKNARLYVTVRDNGSGIASENLHRVFEPFFTTREIGQGLGLGLSISYTVIEQHGGTLIVESVLNEWTQMTFDLSRAG